MFDRIVSGLRFSLLSVFALWIALVPAAHGQESPSSAVPSGQPVTGKTPREPGVVGDGPIWLEDPGRVERGLDGQTPPDQYMESLRATGMLKYLEESGVSPQKKSTASWSLVGPVGGFGSPVRNGRIAGMQIISFGSGYWVYAGSCQGGLWRMHTSNWTSWTDIGDRLPNPSVRAFAVDPATETRIFVGTGDHRRYTGAGMFKTLNGGASWAPVTLPFGGSIPNYFYRIKFLGTDTSSNKRLAAATSLGPIYSDDDGATWQQGQTVGGVDLGSAWTDMVQHPVHDYWLYAVKCDDSVTGTSGVYISQDWGETWGVFPLGNLPPVQDWSRASIAICRDTPGTLAVLIEDENVLRGVFKSTNIGYNWTDITNELITTTPAYSFGNSQIWHAQAITFDPTDANHIYVGAVGLAESTDGGATWDIGVGENGIEVGHADITQLHFNDLSGDNAMWICNDGGIYWLNPVVTLTYSAIGNNTTGLACSEIDYLDAERSTIGIGLQDNGTLLSTDAGVTWDYIESGDGADIEIFDPFDGDVFYNNGMWTSAPTWRTYRLYNGGSKEFTNNPDKYMPSIFYNPRNNKMYSPAGTGLFSMTATGGLAWTAEYADWRPAPYRTRMIFGAYGRDDSFWVNYWTDSTSTNQGNEDLSYIFKGAGGWDVKHWTNFNPSSDDVKTVHPSREWPDEAWVGVKGGSGSAKIFHVRDGGDIKIDITGTLDAVAEIRTIEVMPFNPDVIWVGTDLGVFRTTDGGVTWDPFQDGLPIGRCTEIEFVESPTHGTTHKLLVGLDGRGVWSRDVVMSPVIYVDKDVAASGDGTRFSPYKTVAEGIAAAPTWAVIAVHTDTYYEPQQITKSLKIVTWGGETWIR